MSTLTLPLKAIYFNAIKDGSKVEEYRLYNDYWKKRLEGRSYDTIMLTLGYPKSDDMEKRIELPYLGYTVKEITHEFFGGVPTKVFAIAVDINGDAARRHRKAKAEDEFSEFLMRKSAGARALF